MGIKPKQTKRDVRCTSLLFLDKADRYDRQLAVMPACFLLIK
jgi:hypothetical protein